MQSVKFKFESEFGLDFEIRPSLLKMLKMKPLFVSAPSQLLFPYSIDISWENVIDAGVCKNEIKNCSKNIDLYFNTELKYSTILSHS